jgi:predicted nucleic acid-binding Zn ribbon protein
MLVETRTCERCGEPLPDGSRRDRRFCSDNCRALTNQARYRRARATLLVDPEPVAADEDADFRIARLREALRPALQEERLVAVIAAEARTNWRAAAWLASRLYPAHWGERGREVEVDLFQEADVFTEFDELAARRSRKPDGY